MTPKELLDQYSSGFVGAYCDMDDLDKLMGDLKHPLFEVCAHALYGTGEGKVSLPFRALVKFDPGFGPAEKQTTGDCYQKGTIVFGKHTKFIEDIDVGDIIYGPDGNFTKVITKQQKISYNPLVTIKTKGSYPLTVTSDHLVLIARESSEESESNVLVKNKILKKQWVNAVDIKKGDYLLTPLKLSKENIPKNKFNENKDFLWFLGYFLGDGWCDNRNIEITFSLKENSNFEKCEKLLNCFGINVSKNYYKNKNAFRLRCSDVELATFLRSVCYDYNKEKVFPNWAIGNKDVVKGLIDTDGFRKSDKETFDSSSKSLAYGVYFSFIEMGYNPTINKFYRSKKGSFKTNKEAYRVSCIYNKKKNYSFRDYDHLFIYVNALEINEGPNVVYDIGVEHKEHAFIANGIISHNCVSHSTRNAVDISRSVEIVNGQQESFLLRGATEGIYGSRGFAGEGMTCSQAARFVSTQGGILLRKKYPFADFSVYNSSIGSSWGARGVPKEVLEEGQKHQVKTTSLITTTEGARDALANGYGLSVCSNVGFESTRDKNGISNAKGTWMHAMAWIACDDTKEILNETLFLVQNSWGMWNSGPKRLYQPEGSFWIREQTARRMLNQNGSFAFSNVEGFPLKDIDWTMGEIFS